MVVGCGNTMGLHLSTSLPRCLAYDVLRHDGASQFECSGKWRNAVFHGAVLCCFSVALLNHAGADRSHGSLFDPCHQEYPCIRDRPDYPWSWYVLYAIYRHASLLLCVHLVEPATGMGTSFISPSDSANTADLSQLCPCENYLGWTSLHKDVAA